MGELLIRPCDESDFEGIFATVNDAAQVYKGIIPTDRWKEPYMPRDELRHEIREGVRFWGCEQAGELVGVMGLQQVGDVSLIRHSYVRTAWQSQGIGTRLLARLRERTARPLLVGTWAAAVWAICFYERRGFRLVPPREKDRLLEKYWSIPQRQAETSVVLADRRWFEARRACVSARA